MFNQTLQLKNRLEIRAQKVKKLAVSTRNTLIIHGKIYQNSGTRFVRINIRPSKKKSIILPIDGSSNLYFGLYKRDRVTIYGVRKTSFRTKKPSQTVFVNFFFS